MAAISSISRAHAPSSTAPRRTSAYATAPVFTRPRLYVLAFLAVIAWFAMAIWLGHEKGMRRMQTFDNPNAGPHTSHVHH